MGRALNLLSKIISMMTDDDDDDNNDVFMSIQARQTNKVDISKYKMYDSSTIH